MSCLNMGMILMARVKIIQLELGKKVYVQVIDALW